MLVAAELVEVIPARGLHNPNVTESGPKSSDPVATDFGRRWSDSRCRTRCRDLRAGLAAFSDADRVVPVNLDQFDPLNSRDDLIKLLVETGISFSRPNDSDIAAEDGDTGVEITVRRGDVVTAAARVACELAASWIDDDDVQAWKITTGRFSR